MQKLELIEGVLQPREDSIGARVETLPNDQNLTQELLDFSNIDVITLEFPLFKDGRAFSQARILREKGFTGDLRAVGALFKDQLGMAVRCGFTSFDLETTVNLEGFRVVPGRFAHAYQRPGPIAPAWEVRT